MKLEEMEKRFCEITNLDVTLSTFPFYKSTHKEQKQETIEEFNKKYGFVPTPIFLVDAMICMEQKKISPSSITCDFCAGCGQYTIRLLRYLRFVYKNKFMDVDGFLRNNHYMTELQLSNCACLVYIFGPNINLYVGDSMNLKYSDEEDKGILFFNKDKKIWEQKEAVNNLIFKYEDNLNALVDVFKNYNKIEEEIEHEITVSMKLERYEKIAKYYNKKDEQVEVITVEKVPEVVKQIKEQDKPKEEVKVVKEDKPKKQTKPKKKSIGNNTKEEADDFFGMFGGLKPLKGT